MAIKRSPNNNKNNDKKYRLVNTSKDIPQHINLSTFGASKAMEALPSRFSLPQPH